jgi:7,8-dihydropterin-6-yl-methyl-4-(beta-D-ribofuranosyl)aminobenzene 5'-phosphate synthase
LANPEKTQSQASFEKTLKVSNMLKMGKILLTIFVLLFLSVRSKSQINEFMPNQSEIKEMNEAIQADSNLAKVISWYGDPVMQYSNYKRNLFHADSIWDNAQKMLPAMDIGTTNKLEIIPLIDWFTVNDSLIGESGSSYLIKTDDATILFDLGLNDKQIHPSPLLQNMSYLGIEIDDIDILVLSHNHNDHVGGTKWFQNNTFSFTNYQMELSGISVFTPDKMTYPGLTVNYTPNPTKLAKGVATIGVIHQPVFMTDIKEQALAINVKNKGIVVLVGCGHQTMKKIVERTKILFEEPLYGVLGGFHYPIEEKRNIKWIHKYFVVEKLPWERLTIDDVYANIKLLKSNGVSVVALSGHDSCDKSIEAFRNEFKDSYYDIKVGQKIVIE